MSQIAMQHCQEHRLFYAVIKTLARDTAAMRARSDGSRQLHSIKSQPDHLLTQLVLGHAILVQASLCLIYLPETIDYNPDWRYALPL